MHKGFKLPADEPKTDTTDEKLSDEPIVEEIEIQFIEEPELEDIVLIDLSEIEIISDQPSESEISIEEETVNCYLCNSTINGGTYLCPICGTFYCKKCIKSVVDRGGQCFSCKEVI